MIQTAFFFVFLIHALFGISCGAIVAKTKSQPITSGEGRKRNKYAPLVQPTSMYNAAPSINFVTDSIGDINADASSPSFAPSLPPNSANHPPDCINNASQVAYVNGEISATQTFYNCVNNIADPYNIPTFYNGTFNGIMMIYTNIQVNNLHEIDAVGGAVTLDFYLRLYWQDNRYNMPMFWDKMSKSVRSNGFELTRIYENNGDIQFWLPDIRFHDAASVDYIVETIRLNSSNVFFWSRHVLLTIMQPTLEFSNYPSDEQTIHIRYGSYAYSQSYLKVVFLSPALSFNQNYDGSYTFMENPLWTYEPSDTSTGSYVSSSGFLNVLYHIAVSRQGSGIIVRLILPITLLILLAGLTFWAEYSGRVDSTITLLLAVSALYIVILSNIPLLGYLTATDTYIFWMFLLLVFTCILHQAYATMSEKIDRYPLRPVVLRLIETVGRLTIFPAVTGFYVSTVDEISPGFNITMLVMVGIACAGIAVQEFTENRRILGESLMRLLEKVNDPEMKLSDLSTVELLVFNRWKFQKLSISPMHIAAALRTGSPIAPPHSETVKLRNMTALNDLLKSDRASTDGNSSASSSSNSSSNATKNVREISMSVFADKSRTNSVSSRPGNEMFNPLQRSFSQSSSSSPITHTTDANNSNNNSNNNNNNRLPEFRASSSAMMDSDDEDN